MRRRATSIGFFVFGLVIAVGLWLATEGQQPIFQFGLQRNLSEWRIYRGVIKEVRITHCSWKVFVIGPVVITVRTEDR
jgi:hypothetical protein